MDNFAVIGGSGFYELEELEDIQVHEVETPFGAPTTALLAGRLMGKRCVFLPRHGPAHAVPPHKINYRANIKALQCAGVEYVFSVNAVGGIAPGAAPGYVVVPDQLIDYTYGREHTFADALSEQINHIDFTRPFSETLRNKLISALTETGVPYIGHGVYGCTQGPRLETAAEIQKMRRDGCDLAGMTVMPEAALARELGLEYASLCVVVNRAAGTGEALITMEDIRSVLQASIAKVRRVLIRALAQ